MKVPAFSSTRDCSLDFDCSVSSPMLSPKRRASGEFNWATYLSACSQSPMLQKSVRRTLDSVAPFCTLCAATAALSHSFAVPLTAILAEIGMIDLKTEPVWVVPDTCGRAVVGNARFGLWQGIEGCDLYFEDPVFLHDSCDYLLKWNVILKDWNQYNNDAAWCWVKERNQVLCLDPELCSCLLPN